jgi:hypothetical protein
VWRRKEGWDFVRRKKRKRIGMCVVKDRTPPAKKKDIPSVPK